MDSTKVVHFLCYFTPFLTFDLMYVKTSPVTPKYFYIITFSSLHSIIHESLVLLSIFYGFDFDVCLPTSYLLHVKSRDFDPSYVKNEARDPIFLFPYFDDLTIV